MIPFIALAINVSLVVMGVLQTWVGVMLQEKDDPIGYVLIIFGLSTLVICGFMSNVVHSLF